MKTFKPFWFLEDPLDTEHKYYILMSFLVDLKNKIGKRGFEKKFKELLTIKRDLINFAKETEFSQRTMIAMTEEDKKLFLDLLDKNLEKIEEIDDIVKNSINVIEKFIEENKAAYDLYNSLICVESYSNSYTSWDQGFLVIRKEKEEYMKIFTWFFSIVKIDQKEKAALLMTEILDPRCENTKEISKIKEFLKKNIKDFSEKYDCILIAEIAPSVDLEVGSEMSKEKSIEIILNNFNQS